MGGGGRDNEVDEELLLVVFGFGGGVGTSLLLVGLSPDGGDGCDGLATGSIAFDSEADGDGGVATVSFPIAADFSAGTIAARVALEAGSVSC